MKRAIDVTEDQLELWVNRAGTDTNLRQRKTFSDIRNYLEFEINFLSYEKLICITKLVHLYFILYYIMYILPSSQYIKSIY
jgi:hypothetical protein